MSTGSNLWFEKGIYELLLANCNKNKFNLNYKNTISTNKNLHLTLI